MLASTPLAQTQYEAIVVTQRGVFTYSKVAKPTEILDFIEAKHRYDHLAEIKIKERIQY